MEGWNITLICVFALIIVGIFYYIIYSNNNNTKTTDPSNNEKFTNPNYEVDVRFAQETRRNKYNSDLQSLFDENLCGQDLDDMDNISVISSLTSNSNLLPKHNCKIQTSREFNKDFFGFRDVTNLNQGALMTDPVDKINETKIELGNNFMNCTSPLEIKDIYDNLLKPEFKR